MRSLIEKISASVLYVLLALSVVVVAVFFAGGVVDPAAEITEPVYTDLLIYWVYVLLGLGIIVTLAFSLFQFGLTIKNRPKAAVKQVVNLVGIALILIIAWALGSGEQLSIPGYDGTDNVYFWLKLTDMFLYTIYLLLGVAILGIVVSNLKKVISK